MLAIVRVVERGREGAMDCRADDWHLRWGRMKQLNCSIALVSFQNAGGSWQMECSNKDQLADNRLVKANGIGKYFFG